MAGKAGYDKSTALIVVDVQNDFADPKGSLYVKGGEAVVDAVNAQIGAARAAGAAVFFTQDWHPAHTPHFAKDGGIWPDHCVAGTWGAELHPALQGMGPLRVVRKGVSGEDGYSGFAVADPITGQKTQTRLDAALQVLGIAKLVVVGLATDYCVKATAIDGAAYRDGTRRRYAVTALLGAMAAVDLAPGDGAAAVAAMREAGVRIV